MLPSSSKHTSHVNPLIRFSRGCRPVSKPASALHLSGSSMYCSSSLSLFQPQCRKRITHSLGCHCSRQPLTNWWSVVQTDLNSKNTSNALCVGLLSFFQLFHAEDFEINLMGFALFRGSDFETRVVDRGIIIVVEICSSQTAYQLYALVHACTAEDSRERKWNPTERVIALFMATDIDKDRTGIGQQAYHPA